MSEHIASALLLPPVCRITDENNRFDQAGSRMKIRSPPHSAGHPASKALRSQQARPSVIDSVNVNRLGAS